MPCKPRMRGCGASCGHRAIVDTYRQERQRLENEAEERSLGYDTELKEFLEQFPIGTFKDYLIQTRREPVMVSAPKDNYVWSDMPDGWEVLQDDNARRFTRTDNAVDYAERGLLSTALASDTGVDVLRNLDREDFARPLHQDVAAAVLDLADERLTAVERDNRPTRAEREHLGLSPDQVMPHDATKVTDLLVERGQLPWEWNPSTPLGTIDRSRYGLGAWETLTPPVVTAGPLAQEVRTYRQPRYLEELFARGSALVRGATGPASDVVEVATAVSAARTLTAQGLLNSGFPQSLDATGRPATKGVSPERLAEKIAGSTRRELGLPRRPKLSPVGREVLSHHGR